MTNKIINILLACLSLGLLLSCEDKAKDVPDWRDYMKSGDEEQIAVAKEKIPSDMVLLYGGSRLDSACEQALRFNMGMEIEFDGNATASNGRAYKLRNYMALQNTR